MLHFMYHLSLISNFVPHHVPPNPTFHVTAAADEVRDAAGDAEVLRSEMAAWHEALKEHTICMMRSSRRHTREWRTLYDELLAVRPSPALPNFLHTSPWLSIPKVLLPLGDVFNFPPRAAILDHGTELWPRFDFFLHRHMHQQRGDSQSLTRKHYGGCVSVPPMRPPQRRGGPRRR
jgi:hypothetical protein